jgi:soluble lytic murein transglycosylase
LVALFHLQRGEVEEAKRRLKGVRRAPWTSPAAVLGAELAIADADPAEAISRLEQAAAGLDEFWAIRARELMIQLGEPELARWRARLGRTVANSIGQTRRSSLAIWATLEPDPERLADLEMEVVREVGLDGVAARPEFAPGLAEELWRLGLGSQAVRWDPRGFPRDDAQSTLWTARQFLELGAIRRAIVTADAAWRMAGSDLPIRVYPTDLKRSLYPLPRPNEVWQAAVASRVPWSLLAALAREESRWEPRAVSRVGARGLMQLMPGTASDVAKRLGQPPPTAEELFDPGLSLDLGAAEMRRLMDVFSGRWAPAIAAYNAGEAQAILWLEQCGEGCSEARYAANITFVATRGYTGNVLATASIYAELYGASLDPPLAAAVPSAEAQRTIR